MDFLGPHSSSSSEVIVWCLRWKGILQWLLANWPCWGYKQFSKVYKNVTTLTTSSWWLNNCISLQTLKYWGLLGHLLLSWRLSNRILKLRQNLAVGVVPGGTSTELPSLQWQWACLQTFHVVILRKGLGFEIVGCFLELVSCLQSPIIVCSRFCATFKLCWPILHEQSDKYGWVSEPCN